MIADIELIAKGMDILVRELGIIEAEAFVSYIKNDRFDYTKWRQDKFDDMTLHDIGQDASEFIHKHPFKGDAQIL